MAGLKPGRFVSTAAISWAVLAAAAPARAQESADPRPWIELFDGKSLDGWTTQGAGKWAIEDGAIRMEQGENNGWGALWTNREDFADFELELDWKGANDRTNSGVFFRCATPDPKDRRNGRHSFQADIGQSHHEKGWGGGFLGELVTGWLESGPIGKYMVINRSAAHAVKPYGEWNRYRIAARGRRVILEVNGKRTVDWEDLSPDPLVHPNAIGFQDHGGKGEEGMIVWFRNIRIREWASGEKAQ
jgi:hypothetical protein